MKDGAGEGSMQTHPAPHRCGCCSVSLATSTPPFSLSSDENTGVHAGKGGREAICELLNVPICIEQFAW